jgi:hypothetical protein
VRIEYQNHRVFKVEDNLSIADERLDIVSII